MAVEVVSVIGFAAVWCGVLSSLLEAMTLFRLLWILPVCGVFGFAAADLLGGIVHWFADTYFDPSTPVLGPLLIEPFREHHRDPQGIVRHGFLELSGNSAMATIPIGLGLLALGPPVESVLQQGFYAAATSLAFALFATNGFHRWAHMERPPGLARWLIRLRVALRPEAHRLHHRAAHDSGYCVTSGWLNPLLDRLDFFRRLEASVAALRGESRGRDALRGSAEESPQPAPE